MSFRGGSDRTKARTTAVLQSAVCLALTAFTAGCGSLPGPAGPPAAGTNSKAPAASAAASMHAQLSPGMTLAPVPPAPSAPPSGGKDACGGTDLAGAPGGAPLECEYFTSGSLMPASMPQPPGAISGDYAVRFARIDGVLTMTVRIPCASFAVHISITGDTITPAPETLDSSVGACSFPWDKEQERMARYVQAPMQFTDREKGIVLHNAEWGSRCSPPRTTRPET